MGLCPFGFVGLTQPQMVVASTYITACFGGGRVRGEEVGAEATEGTELKISLGSSDSAVPGPAGAAGGKRLLGTGH